MYREKILSLKKNKPSYFIIPNQQKWFFPSLLDIRAISRNKNVFSDKHGLPWNFLQTFSSFKLPASSINSPILLKIRRKEYTKKWKHAYL